MVKVHKRACREAVVLATSSEAARGETMDSFLRDISAASSRASACSMWKTWTEFHRLWFGTTEDVLPLTQEKVFGAAACFKAGGYKAYPAYISKAKELHVLEGHPWSVQLDRF